MVEPLSSMWWVRSMKAPLTLVMAERSVTSIKKKIQLDTPLCRLVRA